MPHTADSSSIYQFASKRRFVWRYGSHTVPQFRVQWLCPPRPISSHGLVRNAFSDVAGARTKFRHKNSHSAANPKRKYEKRNEVTRSVAGSVAPTNKQKKLHSIIARRACVQPYVIGSSCSINELGTFFGHLINDIRFMGYRKLSMDP